MQWFLGLISAVVFAAGIAGIILSAFFPEWMMRDAMIGLSVFFLVAAIYTFVMVLLFAKTPVTVVNTFFRISMNEDYSLAKFSRSQMLRANRPDVSAYFTKSSPSNPSGKIVNLKVGIYCPGAVLDNILDEFGDESRGYEIIHGFGRYLRYRWFMLLIPTWWLKGEEINDLPGFIRNNLAVRTQSHELKDEFNCKKPRLNFAAVDYPQHNISFEIKFSGGIPKNLKIKRLQPHGVVDVMSYESHKDKDVVVFRIPRLHKETLRIYWENTN